MLITVLNMSEDEYQPSKSDSKVYKLFFSTSDMIDIMREQPCLWNKDVPEYRDKFARTKAWEEVYRQLEPAYDDMDQDMKIKIGQQITKKWFNVRDAYLKSIKDRGSRRPYVYSRQISFLNPFLSAEKSDESIYIEEEHLITEERDQLTEPSFVYVEELDVPKKRRKTGFEVKKEPREVTDEFVESNSVIGNEDDPEKAFFTSIVPVVKTLSMEAKLEFQIQVLKVLKNIKKKDQNGEEFN